MAKHKIASISLTVRDRAISSKFSPTGYLRNVIFGIFKKFSPPQKWRPFWVFEFLLKMAKHKFASISLTVRDRAISSKFSTHRVSKECTLCNFQKIFPSPKMAAILNFRIFAKYGNKFASISLTVRDRAISSKFSPTGYLSIVVLAIFKKFSPPQKWRPFWVFEFLPKMAKH